MMKITNVNTQFRLYAIQILETETAMAVIITSALAVAWTITIFYCTVSRQPTALWLDLIVRFAAVTQKMVPSEWGIEKLHEA